MLSADATTFALLNEGMTQLAESISWPNEEVDNALEEFQIIFHEHKSYFVGVQYKVAKIWKKDDGIMPVSKGEAFENQNTDPKSFNDPWSSMTWRFYGILCITVLLLVFLKQRRWG